ncbi:hydroxymethylbilane synthase [Isoptericola jiangsuensis]|uniref:Porphobilinogen deaminase n=1 Tax=Isoptericola jiangsuensis TaxID=548579 RepID=A0A2A9F039_9MICO|nr:hydroxymethylbilane synthase [Isoptericola jiangsuensis]PFG44674.1 hydroxymethylbilane synthase [Isoptericola jiangsuensis]
MSTPTAPLRLGTRASALATTQSSMIARRLTELLGHPVELVHIRSEGDIDRTSSLASLGGTGVFVTALREALVDGRCDVAVHSLKDLPTGQPEGLTVVTPEREDPRDALCARDGMTLDDLPRGGRVGTGSPRRAAQLRAARPDLDVVDIRGNVETRLARALGPEADLDAVVLAYAGLSRLGRTEVVSQVLDPTVVAPAPGQGALAVEARTADLDATDLAAAFAALDHRATRLSVLAERSVLARLEAGCAAPIGAYARVEEDELTLSAVVAKVDGSEQIVHTARLDLGHELAAAAADEAALALGVRVAEALLTDGAARLAPLSDAAPAPASSEPERTPTGTDDPEVP